MAAEAAGIAHAAFGADGRIVRVAVEGRGGCCGRRCLLPCHERVGRRWSPRS
ncbi:MAG: hypothetical protein MZV70_19650 [Desulfobacterales bacterium]|nr:hypothetical protein [Desulfobacterales bacterium]